MDHLQNKHPNPEVCCTTLCVFCVTNVVLKDLVMIPVHTKPEDSDKELDELYDVFLNVKKKWRTDVRTTDTTNKYTHKLMAVW